LWPAINIHVKSASASDNAICTYAAALVLQDATAEQCLQDVIDTLSSQIADSSSSNGNSTPEQVCISSNGIAIQPARVASTPASLRLQFTSGRNSAAAEAYAQEAASKAAALNADAGNAQGYTMVQQVRAAVIACLIFDALELLQHLIVHADQHNSTTMKSMLLWCPAYCTCSLAFQHINLPDMQCCVPRACCEFVSG
jgi:hypothetical protein